MLHGKPAVMLGGEVQTVRLALDAFPALAHVDKAVWVDFAVELEALGREHGGESIALGPAGQDALSYLPAIFAATQSVFGTSHREFCYRCG